MAEKFPLSEGALRLIMRGGEIKDPIMQVLGSKKIASGSSDKERFRILLSDGKHFITFAMLTKQMNDTLAEGDLSVHSIVKLKNYITSVINNAGKGNKRVLVILEMETLLAGDKIAQIGNPQTLPDDLEDTAKSNGANGHAESGPRLAASTARHDSGDLNVSLQDHLTHPISSLSPYQNKWVIKARVMNKSQIRKWSNSRGEGQLFSIDLIDESGEIRATAFKELVDKLYAQFEVDKVYYITKCQLKVANKQFSSLKNDYEMTFTNDSIVQECHDANIAIPQTQYDFVDIHKIAHIETGTLIDVIGVCKETSDVNTFQAKSTGRELKKREVTLIDQSNTAIALTLWGNEAEQFNGAAHPVVVIKGAKVGEFGGGKNISVHVSSIMKLNPDIAECHRIRGWYEHGGGKQQINITNISAKSGAGGFLTPWMTFKEAQDAGLGNAEKGDYYQAKATVLLFRGENSFYKACPSEDCNKKVIDLQNGMFRCEKCNREYPNFKYRLLGSMNVGDWTGNQWISLFASEAEKVLGMTSQEVGESAEENPEALVDIADKANFKQFILKLRAKLENYNDESRLKTVAIRVDRINFKEYNEHLITRIKQLM